MATPSAAGLFQKAIVQSGSLLNTMESKYSRQIGLEVMKELNLKASQIDELANVPYAKLLETGNNAVVITSYSIHYTKLYEWQNQADQTSLPSFYYRP